MAPEIDGTSKGLLGGFAVFALGSGIASLIYGVFLLLRYMSIEYNFGIFNLFSTSILLIVVGSLLIITVIVGVIGALKDKLNLRLATLVLLFILFAILAAVGTWGMVVFKTDRLQGSIKNDIASLKAAPNGELSPELKPKADYLYRQYNCCGVDGIDSTRANEAGIPESCCIIPGCGGNPLDNTRRYFEKGCASVYFATKSIAVYHLSILALAAAGAALLALILYGVIYQRARAGYAAVSRG